MSKQWKLAGKLRAESKAGEKPIAINEARLVSQVLKKLPTIPDPEALAALVISKLPPPQEVVLPSQLIPFEIARGLETLENDDRLSYLALKDRPTWIGEKAGAGIGGGGGTAFNTFLSLLDTPDTYTGAAGQVVTVNPTEDGLIFTTNVSSDEKVKVSAADTTAGYLSAKLVNGTDITFAILTPAGNETYQPSLTTTGVTAASYGSASAVGTFTVDSRGRLSAAATVPISITSSAVSDFVEAAQDAVGAMVDSTLVYVDATPLLTRAALTGDITAPQSSNVTTLATVNANVGTFGSATQVGSFTVNAKGLITAASNIAIAPIVTTTTIYVDSNRVDAYTETGSVQYPYKTLGAAITGMNSFGYTAYGVVLAAGTYIEAGDITFPNAGLVIMGNGSVIVTNGGLGGGNITLSNAFDIYDVTLVGNILQTNTSLLLLYQLMNGFSSGNMTSAGYLLLNDWVTDTTGVITVNAGAICTIFFSYIGNRIVNSGSLTLAETIQARSDNANYNINSSAAGSLLYISATKITNAGTGGGINCANGATAASPNFITDCGIFLGGTTNGITCGTAFTILDAYRIFPSSGTLQATGSNFVFSSYGPMNLNTGAIAYPSGSTASFQSLISSPAITGIDVANPNITTMVVNPSWTYTVGQSWGLVLKAGLNFQPTLSSNFASAGTDNVIFTAANFQPQVNGTTGPRTYTNIWGATCDPRQIGSAGTITAMIAMRTRGNGVAGATITQFYALTSDFSLPVSATLGTYNGVFLNPSLLGTVTDFNGFYVVGNSAPSGNNIGFRQTGTATHNRFQGKNTFGADVTPVFVVDATETSTATSGTVTTARIQQTLNPASASTSTVYGIDLLVNTTAANANNPATTVNGQRILVQRNATETGSITTQRGLTLFAFNNAVLGTGQGAVTTLLEGAEINAFDNSNTTTATTTIRGATVTASISSNVVASRVFTNAQAIYVAVGMGSGSTSTTITNLDVIQLDAGTVGSLNRTGTITNAVGLNITGWTTAGVFGSGLTFTNAPEQIRLQSMAIAGSMGIRQQGTVPHNRFEGQVMIGADAAPNGFLEIRQAATTGTVEPDMLITQAANTAMTASTERISIHFNTTANQQWNTGALITQRNMVVGQPTYRFVGASTLTEATNVWIGGAPAAGTNATLTSSIALQVNGGTLSAGVTTGTSLLVTAPTGAGTNYAALFFGDILASTFIRSNGATSGIGYATGAGTTVTQATNKSTGVTINTVCGTITMNGAALGNGAEVGFTVTNSTVAATDTPVVVIKSGATADAYNIHVDAVAAGSFRISIGNVSGGSLSEAVVLSFAIIKAVAA